MYTVSFYFPLSELENILKIINFLGRNFSEIFIISFDGVAYTDLQKFLQLRDSVHDEIWCIPTINDNGPHASVKFWNDAFAISLSISVGLFKEMPKLYKNMLNHNDFQEFMKDVKNFAQGIIKNADFSILAIDFGDGDGPCENGWKDLQRGDIAEYMYFAYIQENGKMRYIQGKNTMF